MKKPHAMIGLLAALGTAIGVLVAVVGLPYGRANYTAFAGLYHGGDLDNPVLAGHLAIDCDPGTIGVQEACTFSNTAGSFSVDLVFSDNSGAGNIGSFGLMVRNPGTNFTAPENANNPDLNDSVFGAGWNCTFFPATANTGALAVPPTTGTEQSSELGCFKTSPFVTYTAGQEIVIASILYDKIAGSVGTSTLTWGNAVVADGGGIELVSCYGVDGAPGGGDDGDCFTAAITLEPPAADTSTPTPTDTAVPPTSTQTPLPTATPAGASVIKIPESCLDPNSTNCDPSIPAANLWICVTGPCSGPGEGNLIVFEYATNVNTGDFNGDTVPDGLGAYEFTVEYDNFVIASVNPSDVVFAPLGSISPWPGGADGVLDGEGFARAPATCSFSITTENFVRFGCVTSGPNPGPLGDFDLARLNLIPHEDLRSDLIPGNNNGVVTIIKDNNCELADVFGHPVTGSVNGGLLPVCGNLAVTVRMLEGDLNLDCKVDVQDQQLIAFRFASEFGSTLFDRFFDLEPALGDLDIDIKDIQKVFGRDGSTCQNPIPAQPPLAPAIPF